MDKQQTIREILLKYTLPDALKPEYDGMTAWELAGIILKEVEDKNPELVEIINKMFKLGKDPLATLYQQDCDIQAEAEETLCGNPHNNGENEPKNCGECLAIKLNI